MDRIRVLVGSGAEAEAASVTIGCTNGFKRWLCKRTKPSARNVNSATITATSAYVLNTHESLVEGERECRQKADVTPSLFSFFLSSLERGKTAQNEIIINNLNKKKGTERRIDTTVWLGACGFASPFFLVCLSFHKISTPHFCLLNSISALGPET